MVRNILQDLVRRMICKTYLSVGIATSWFFVGLVLVASVRVTENDSDKNGIMAAQAKTEFETANGLLELCFASANRLLQQANLNQRKLDIGIRSLEEKWVYYEQKFTQYTVKAQFNVEQLAALTEAYNTMNVKVFCLK